MILCAMVTTPQSSCGGGGGGGGGGRGGGGVIVIIFLTFAPLTWYALKISTDTSDRGYR